MRALRAISALSPLLCLSAWALAKTPSAKPQAIPLASLPQLIKTVSQVTALTNAQADNEIPVDLEGTVTYVRPSEKNLFIADGEHGIYVSFRTDMGLLPGDRVEIKGKTDSSFRPVVIARQVRWLYHGKIPPPRPALFPDLIQSKWDSRLIQISGRVLAAAMDGAGPDANLRIRMGVAEGTLEGIIAHPGNLLPENLLDADIQIRGVAGGAFDSKMQMAGVWIDIYSSDGVTVLRKPAVNPWSMPIVTTEEVVYAFRDTNESKRSHIAGTLTYFEPGSLAVIERDGMGMLARTSSHLPLHAGEGVEATGFPAVQENVRLDDAQLRSVAQSVEVRPRLIDWKEAAKGHYAYNLVSMEGEVVGVVHDARVDLFVIWVDGHLFSASVRANSSDARVVSDNSALPSIGSRVRVTGVCFVDAGNHWKDGLWFELRMRSIADILVLQTPSWWTVKHLAYLISLLALAIVGAVVWVWLLERRLRAQSAIISKQSQEEARRERRLNRLEQERSHILELISSFKPLNEVLEAIESLVSTRLGGVRCWFTLLGSEPAPDKPSSSSRTGELRHELFSPEGASFGFLHADVPLAEESSSRNPQPDTPAILLAGARLAELAIDTRRLYSDLRRRSEYDLLTNIPNRFSFERQLSEVMAESQLSGKPFALVYVDLDRFKAVNDRYGHRAGDLYLQEVAKRMKRQLRSVDLLARIGGDEFLCLVPSLRSRSDAEEIALRLERCFDELFEIDGRRLRGSASVGFAVYPEDGSTQEELQRSADAAMYVHKESKKHDEMLA